MGASQIHVIYISSDFRARLGTGFWYFRMSFMRINAEAYESLEKVPQEILKNCQLVVIQDTPDQDDSFRIVNEIRAIIGDVASPKIALRVYRLGGQWQERLSAGLIAGIIPTGQGDNVEWEAARQILGIS